MEGTDSRLGRVADWIDAASFPVLGICVGHQFLARHFGGRVAHTAAPGVRSRGLKRRSTGTTPCFKGCLRDFRSGRVTTTRWSSFLPVGRRWPTRRSARSRRWLIPAGRSLGFSSIPKWSIPKEDARSCAILPSYVIDRTGRRTISRVLRFDLVGRFRCDHVGPPGPGRGPHQTREGAPPVGRLLASDAHPGLRDGPLRSVARRPGKGTRSQRRRETARTYEPLGRSDGALVCGTAQVPARSAGNPGNARRSIPDGGHPVRPPRPLSQGDRDRRARIGRSAPFAARVPGVGSERVPLLCDEHGPVPVRVARRSLPRNSSVLSSPPCPIAWWRTRRTTDTNAVT